MGEVSSCSTGYFSLSVGPALPGGGVDEDGVGGAFESIEGGRAPTEPPWLAGLHAPGGAQTDGRKRSIGVHTTETRGVIDMRAPPGSMDIRGEKERGVTLCAEPTEPSALA